MDNELKGIMILPDASEIPDFKLKKSDFKDYTNIKLTSGKIVKEQATQIKKLFFDFDDGEQNFWKGYVRGFLYEDGKFLGKAHYVRESKLQDEVLNGNYKYKKGELEVKGILYDAENKKFGFAFFLNKAGIHSAIHSNI
ncbi:MAG: hypothetical protein KAY50_03745 [Chitinophagaceae bacterium]|nr:hypothetical protein [Chitinophagaceae bacterium]